MKPISVYVHWPFCLSLCPYCDFNSHLAEDIDPNQWLGAYGKELEHYRENLDNKEVKSIFFGGGTPSLMSPLIVEGIINKIAKLAKIADNCEITLEANPTSFEAEKFKQFRFAGVNRVSIGVQSFNDADLAFLGRKHSGTEAIAAINQAAEIFPRFSFDLIYARPRQSLESWRSELETALNLAHGHLSLYQLTIEKGTPFFAMARNKAFILPDSDQTAQLYEFTCDFLASKGYGRYEISNYAFLGEESMHNLAYWHYNEYLGIGAGAHSRIYTQDHIEAIMTFHKPAKWLGEIERVGHAKQQQIILTQDEVIEELIMMVTRLASGINDGRLQMLTGKTLSDVLDHKTLASYQKEGFLVFENDNLRLTDKGLIVHNYIVPRLLVAP